MNGLLQCARLLGIVQESASSAADWQQSRCTVAHPFAESFVYVIVLS